MISKTLSLYRIVAKLGLAGVGEVHEANDIQPERRVANEMLHPGLAANPKLPEASSARPARHV